MMIWNILRLTVLTICLCLFCRIGICQDYNYHHLTINEGLPSDKVRSVTQDAAGFMYFATSDGLVRYDGERMLVYRKIAGDTTSLPVNKVIGLFTDREGRVWCAHDQYGVSVLNPVTGNFQRFAFAKITKSGVFNGYLNEIFQAADGKIYACTFGDSQSVFIIEPASGQVEQFFLASHDPDGVLKQKVSDVISFHFHSDSLWFFGTTNGLVFYNPLLKKVRKIVRLNPVTEEHWDNFFSGFVTDHRGNVYAGSWTTGLHYFDLTTGSRTTYKKVQDWSDLQSCSPKMFINDSVLLVAGWDVLLMNTRTKKIVREKQDMLNRNAVAGNTSNAYRSADGTIWLSTLSGVNYFHPGKLDFKSVFLAGADERLQINPKYEQHWILFDPFTKTYVINYYIRNRADKNFMLSLYDEQFRHLANLPNPVTNNHPLCAIADLKGRIFFSGTRNSKTALFMLDLKTKKLNDVLSGTFLADSLHIASLHFSNDSLLLLDVEQNLLIILSAADKKILSCRYVPIPVSIKVPAGTMRSCFDSRRQLLWLGGRNGLFSLSVHDLTVSEFLPDSLKILRNESTTISALCLDATNRLWLAHAGGISCVLPESKMVIAHYNETTLPSLNTLNLFPDSSGYIWSDCSKGLIRLDATHGLIQLFTGSQGLQPRCYPGTAELLANGKMTMPFPGGLLLYDTRKKESVRKLKAPVITAIKNFQDTETGKGIFTGNEFVRSHNQNQVSIEFAALNYAAGSFTRYAYQLEGIHPGFISTRTPFLTFNNLAPGSYQLRLKSSDDGLNWSPERSLSIIIQPPWYRTWWFRSLLFGGCLSLVILGYQYRIGQVRKEERMQNTFRRQLMEMEMKALRSQMNPHFIFNSLNSIHRYVMQNDRLTASEYLARFGKLIRNVLDNSAHKTITLKQEIDTLDLYLQMEKLRFEDKFDYRIVIDDAVDTAAVKIPPLLIQPFAENSIWHGLMHKDEKGLLQITVNMKGSENIEISIEDDGIGRAKAAELKSKDQTHHSHGLKVTTERIRLINEMYKQQNKVIVDDLYSDSGAPSGTRVTLLLPINVMNLSAGPELIFPGKMS